MATTPSFGGVDHLRQRVSLPADQARIDRLVLAVSDIDGARASFSHGVRR